MLDTGMTIIILLETIITLLILYGFRHESELILFEDLIIYHLKNFIKNVKILKK